MTRRFDLVVIGAGPAGVSAALAADALGLHVLLLDDQLAPGGQIYRGVDRLEREGRAAAFGPDYVHGLSLTRRLSGSKVDYRPQTRVWQIETGFTVFASHDDGAFGIEADAVVIAAGAMERPVPIRNWTSPGVMTVGAAQILLKSGAVLPSEPLWIAGQGPLLLLYAAQLLAAGVRPAGILDTTPKGALARGLPHVPGALANWRYLLKGAGFLAAIRRAGVPLIRGVTEVEAIGSERVSAVRYRAGGAVMEAPAATLLLHEGVVPHVHMTMALGARHRWDAALRAPVPVTDEWGETSLPGAFVAGDAGGIGGARLAEAHGARAAVGAARRLGRIDAADADARLQSITKEAAAHARIRPFLDAVFTPRADIHVPPDDVIVCRCEEVTAGAVRAAVKSGCLGPNQVKSFTRCGMGPCQGRQCALTLQHVVAEARGLEPADLDALTIRPPLKPLTLGELASLAEPLAGSRP